MDPGDAADTPQAAKSGRDPRPSGPGSGDRGEPERRSLCQLRGVRGRAPFARGDRSCRSRLQGHPELGLPAASNRQPGRGGSGKVDLALPARRPRLERGGLEPIDGPLPLLPALRTALRTGPFTSACAPRRRSCAATGSSSPRSSLPFTTISCGSEAASTRSSVETSASTSTRTSPRVRSSAWPSRARRPGRIAGCSSGTPTRNGGYLWLTYHSPRWRGRPQLPSGAAQPEQRIRAQLFQHGHGGDLVVAQRAAGLPPGRRRRQPQSTPRRRSWPAIR